MADPALLNAIAQGTTLSHVETTDKSVPIVDPKGAVLGEIQKGHELKHAETTDKSAPLIESDVHIKKIDRAGFLNEVTAEHQLAHVETVDKSVPHVEGAHVKKNAHGALLEEIKKH